AKKLAKDVFPLVEAKTDASYLDDDTGLFATDFGKGSLTNSGYARIVKLWKRGTPIASARMLFEGKVTDVLAAPATLHTSDGNSALVIRAVSFFENEYYAVDAAKATVKKLPLPLSADVKGMIHSSLIATLRQDYADPASGDHFAKGALMVFRDGYPPQSLYAPAPRANVETVAVGRDGIYASITQNVIGSVHVFRHGEGGWTDRGVILPRGGAADVVSVHDFG